MTRFGKPLAASFWPCWSWCFCPTAPTSPALALPPSLQAGLWGGRLRPWQHPAASPFLRAAPSLHCPHPPCFLLPCPALPVAKGGFPPIPRPTLQQVPGGGRQGEACCRHAEVPHQHLHQWAGEPAGRKGRAAWTQPRGVPAVPWLARLTTSTSLPL